jgi:predicted MFS family arabinose efflux permease
MGASTFGLVVFAVLAVELIDEFGIDRWQVGALVTATTISGAVISPSVGTLTDRIGARRATIVTLIVSGGALVAMSVSPVFALVAVFALVGGIGQAIANPATNKLISMHVPTGARGVITGIKQSGVQAGTFLGGLLLPVITLSFDWRWAVAVFGLASLAGGLWAWASLPRDVAVETESGSERTDQRMPPVIRSLAVYGFLLGFAGTAIFTYLPLYAEEALGYSASLAGYVVAFVGSVGVAGRIGWGRLSERRLGAMRSLQIISVLSAVSALLLVAADTAPWVVWVAALTTGLSASSWNAVGMLAIIQAVPTRRAGRGSGVVLAGFLLGLGLGAPSFGYSVDRLETYVPGWLAIAVVFLAALTVTRAPIEKPV